MYLIPYFFLASLILFQHFYKKTKFSPYIYFIFISLIFLAQVYFPCQWDLLGYEVQKNWGEYDSFINQIFSSFTDSFFYYKLSIQFFSLLLLMISLKKSLKISGTSIFAISSIAFIQLSGFTAQNLSDLSFLVFLVTISQNFIFGYNFLNLLIIIFSIFISTASHLSGLGQIVLLLLSAFSARYFLNIKTFGSFIIKPNKKIIRNLFIPLLISAICLFLIILLSQSIVIFGIPMYRYFKSIAYLFESVFSLGTTRLFLIMSELVLSLFALRKMDIVIQYLHGRKKKFLIMGILYISILLSIRVFAAFYADYIFFGRLSFIYLISLIFFLGFQDECAKNTTKSFEMIKIFGLLKYNYLNDLILIFLTFRSINYIVSVYTNSPLYCKDFWYVW